ncbi:C39 family peptidase [Effusibacillus consociatus]|uniref:C39 family peptidase n=1 Tax=Effusibacillus consociatus TaxID=1117041 RepID=A0ABV9Q0I3_9BACL
MKKRRNLFFALALSIGITGLVHKMQVNADLLFPSSGEEAVRHVPQDVSKIPPQDQNRKILIRVPAQSQAELYNGCEVTSLSMLLSAAGHPFDKNELAYWITKDGTPLQEDEDDTIISWGDPNSGFVGDITGESPGYGVYHGPVAQLIDTLLSEGAEDLTGQPFDEVLSRVASGKPVLVWATVEFQPTSSWVKWTGPHGTVTATFDEHAVLLVGFDANHVYINDPQDGTAGKAVDRQSFIAAWEQLGKQAVTFKG